MSQITLTIDSMNCGGCVSAIKDTLSQMDGITSIDVHLPTKSVCVEGSVSADELTHAIAQHRHWCFARVVQRAKAKERLERLQCLA